MKIQRLKLRNFRKFAEKEFGFHPQFTVLIGDNATGKTAILDALATLMGTYLLKADKNIPSGRKGMFREEGRLVAFEKERQVMLEPQKPVFVSCQAKFRGRQVEWDRAMGDKGGRAKELIAEGERDFEAVSKGVDVDLPVLLYYGAGRLWDKHSQVELAKPESRLVGYRNCLDPKSDQYLFQQWFKQLSLGALQDGITIPAVEVVRQVVLECIPNADNFFYDARNDMLMIRLPNSGAAPFNNLSDGYRNMISMVADIAHRISRLNPHLGERAAAEAEGVVLIDEIDLHLHPNWQRRVVGDLKRIFPNLQFIVTTHSPFIIQALGPGELIDLNHEQAVMPLDPQAAQPAPGQPFSNRSIEDIAEDVMGVPVPQRSQRYQQMYDVAKEYYRLLEQGTEVDELQRATLEQKLDELTAPFSDEVAYHAFLEMERLGAGLRSSKKAR